MLCCGIGFGSGLPVVIHGISVNISSLFIATIVGVLLNLCLPKEMRGNEPPATKETK